MAEKMLSPFKIRNLKSSNQSSGRQDGLVRISAPGYDGTMSNNPTAGLKYRDEEDDIITVNLSHQSGPTHFRLLIQLIAWILS